MAERLDYDALAQDINLKDITSCERNANILRILRDGDPNWNKKLFIVNEESDDGNISDFLVQEGDDLGWLGYFVGKCKVLEKLYIWYLPEGGDQINRFLEGMSQNQSIEDLYICNDVGADGWSSLGSFLENNRTLLYLDLDDFVIGHESAQNLASALGRMHLNSPLKRLSMESTEIGDEGIAEITTTLRLQSQLKNLRLYNNDIGRSGSVALGNTLSSWPHSNNLESLDLGCNVIDDGGLQALAEGLMNCRSLKAFDLSHNQSITAAGLRYLFPLLQSEAHSLETLSLHGINFGDDGAMILLEGLRGNRFLEELHFDVVTAGITTIGWSAFSTLLCDTSTINNTYLSNHSLTRIGNYQNGGNPQDVVQYLAINEHSNAAICKILRGHPDLDMEPFFKLNMQFLPAVMSWFERVEPIEEQLIEEELIEESERSCQSRKLSALYKFVRGMPDLTITGYWEGRMIHIESERRRIAGERRRLDDEERRLEYEEKVTLERLGDRPVDEDEAKRNKRMRHE